MRACTVGEEPIEKVHLYENHSSALMAWRRAGVRSRILLHLDGHIDLDWLPDETVARIAAARPPELRELELHPYTLDGHTLSRFGIWNFIYPAARLGMVRQLIWVVPDGTLRGPGPTAPARLVRSLLSWLQAVSLEEAAGLRVEGATVSGVLLGIPVVICELGDLPEIDEPVLLDIDLDYFTTQSATTRAVTENGWLSPGELVEALRGKRVRTDLVTLSLSTIGGYLPVTSRWLGHALKERLGAPQQAFESHRLHQTADQALVEGDLRQARRAYRLLVQTDAEDADAWYSLCRLNRLIGDDQDPQACQRAVRLDPLLEHAALFEADRFWINRQFSAARELLNEYLDSSAEGPFRAYALRRRADCLWQLGSPDEAERDFRAVLELAPDHGDTHADLGQLLRERQRIGEAIFHLETARALLPERAQYALALGTTYLLAGRVDEALAQLQEAVQRQPCHAEAQGNLAVALMQLGRVEEARPHVATGLAIQPRHAALRRISTELDRRGLRVQPVRSIPAN